MTDLTALASISQTSPVVIIGAGPAGLMAAEILSAAGCAVEIFDAMPTAGRKFLMAGRGGLNLTHSEIPVLFQSRFQHGHQAPVPGLHQALTRFGNLEVRAWADGLGAETFVGSSGRVFPKIMKAAPLLRAWLRRLQNQGVKFHLRHRWVGWSEDSQTLQFDSPEGLKTVKAERCLLALGGGSWPRLGSDGRWQETLAEKGVALVPMLPANCGFNVDWSQYLVQRFAGQPLKHIRLIHIDAVRGVTHEKRGDVVITQYGLEGGAIYALSAGMRDAILRDGQAVMQIDLMPDRDVDWIVSELSKPRGSRSWTSFLQSNLGLSPVVLALLRECLPAEARDNPYLLAAGIKFLPVPLKSPRPLEESISTAGGVSFDALGDDFQLKNVPGVFCAGEMLDWEAPTGGYLLTGCLATGRAAANGILRSL